MSSDLSGVGQPHQAALGGLALLDFFYKLSFDYFYCFVLHAQPSSSTKWSNVNLKQNFNFMLIDVQIINILMVGIDV